MRDRSRRNHDCDRETSLSLFARRYSRIVIGIAPVVKRIRSEIVVTRSKENYLISRKLKVPLSTIRRMHLDSLRNAEHAFRHARNRRSATNGIKSFRISIRRGKLRIASKSDNGCLCGGFNRVQDEAVVLHCRAVRALRTSLDRSVGDA